MVSCQTAAEEVSFERSHLGISSTVSKVRTAQHVSIIDSGSDRGFNSLVYNFLELRVCGVNAHHHCGAAEPK